MGACFLIPWKLAAAEAEPKLAVLVMLTTAAVLNSLTALTQRKLVSRPSKDIVWPITWGLAAVFSVLTLVGNWASAEAVARISGALLAVTQRCEIVVVALLGSLVLGERVRWPFWGGAGIAGAGLWLLQQPSAEPFDPVGVLYGLGSAACFGAMIVLARRYILRAEPVVLNAVRLWMAVGLWFVVERRLPRGDELTTGLLFYGGLAGFFGPFLSRMGALLSARHVAAHVTALMSLVTPVLTLVLAYLFLRQLPARRELLGGSIMLMGVALPVVALLRRG